MSNARKYNKRIEIWQTTEVPDGFGGNTINTAKIGASWAKIKTSANNRTITQRLTDLGIINQELAIIVTCRKRNDLPYNPINQFLKYRGDQYVIKTVTEKDLGNVEVEIIATREPITNVPVLTT